MRVATSIGVLAAAAVWAGEAAAQERPGPRAEPGLVGFASRDRGRACGRGERLVRHEERFYSVPMMIAGIGVSALAPLVGLAVGAPMHSADPGGSAWFYGGFVSGALTLAVGLPLAIIGGHKIRTDVYAVGRVRPGPGGIAVSF